jgi:hypothetical protein
LTAKRVAVKFLLRGAIPLSLKCSVARRTVAPSRPRRTLSGAVCGPRLLTALEPLLPPLEIPLFLGVLELLARVAVFSARPPVPAPGIRPVVGGPARFGGIPRVLLRGPQFAAGEILHFRIWMFLLDALERRQQLLALGGAERGRQAASDDRPVRVAWGH